MRIVTPAWWCETCESWWPGPWVLEGDPELRTCAECGTDLVPRGRPTGLEVPDDWRPPDDWLERGREEGEK